MEIGTADGAGGDPYDRVTGMLDFRVRHRVDSNVTFTLPTLCIARRNRDRRNNSRPGLLKGFGTGAPSPTQGRGNSRQVLLDQDYAGSIVTRSLDPAIRARANDGD